MKIVTFESTDADPNMRAAAVIMVISDKAPETAGESPRKAWTRLLTPFYAPDQDTARERAQTFWDAELAKTKEKAGRPRKVKGEAPPEPEPEGVEALDVGDVI